jgi:flagellar secretion chaperone FliS
VTVEMTRDKQDIASYRRTQIETASPLQLVVLLYDGAIENLAAAKTAISSGDVAAKSHSVDRALAILGELQATLDKEKGAEIAERLDALYTYFCEQVVEASVRLDTAPLDHVIELLGTIRGAWHEISIRPSSADGLQVPSSGEPRSRVSVRT